MTHIQRYQVTTVTVGSTRRPAMLDVITPRLIKTYARGERDLAVAQTARINALAAAIAARDAS